jgi:hypothetical protein
MVPAAKGIKSVMGFLVVGRGKLDVNGTEERKDGRLQDTDE